MTQVEEICQVQDKQGPYIGFVESRERWVFTGRRYYLVVRNTETKREKKKFLLSQIGPGYSELEIGGACITDGRTYGDVKFTSDALEASVMHFFHSTIGRGINMTKVEHKVLIPRRKFPR